MRRRRARAFALLGVGLLLLLPWIVLRLQVVPGVSMEPLLHPGDIALVDVAAYRWRMPMRGEVVSFTDEGGQEQFLRVAGIGGDTVEIAGVQVRVNGVQGAPGHEEVSLLDRSPLPGGTWRVPGGTVFLLGDCRRPGRDSRHFGPVPFERLRGRAAFLLLPQSRQGWL